MLHCYAWFAAGRWTYGRRSYLTDRPLRSWPVYSYLVIYDPLARPIQTVRVPAWGARCGRQLPNAQDESGFTGFPVVFWLLSRNFLKLADPYHTVRNTARISRCPNASTYSTSVLTQISDRFSIFETSNSDAHPELRRAEVAPFPAPFSVHPAASTPNFLETAPLWIGAAFRCGGQENSLATAVRRQAAVRARRPREYGIAMSTSCWDASTPTLSGIGRL